MTGVQTCQSNAICEPAHYGMRTFLTPHATILPVVDWAATDFCGVRQPAGKRTWNRIKVILPDVMSSEFYAQNPHRYPGD